MKTLPNSSRLTSLLAVLLLALGVSARAQSYTTTSAVSNYWSTLGAWLPGIPPVGGGSNFVVSFQGVGLTGTQLATNDLGTAANGGFLLNYLNCSTGSKGVTISGSNLVFVATTAGVPPVFNNSTNSATINCGLVLSNNLTVLGNVNPTIGGVISGSGNITNNRATGVNAPVFIGGNANTFVGTWIVTSNSIVEFKYDGSFGNAANGIVVNSAGGIQWQNFSLGAGRNIALGSGTVTFNSGADGRVLTLASSTNNLTGNPVVVLEGGVGSGNYTFSGVNFATNQPGFTGSILATRGGTLFLSASNALPANTSLIATNGGGIVVSNGYALTAGALVATNGGAITLGTTPPADSGMQYSVDASSDISGTDAELAGLSSGVNLTIANGAMIVHQDAAGTGIPVNLANNNFVYGYNGSSSVNPTIGDALSTQWRGLGAGRINVSQSGNLTIMNLGPSANTINLNGNADLMAMPTSTLLISNQITGGSVANTLSIRGLGTVQLANVNNNFANLINGGGGNLSAVHNNGATMTLNFADGVNTLNSLYNTTNGVLTLSASANSTNNITGGNGFFRNQNTNGVLNITGGTWSTPGLSGNGTSWTGTNVITNATVIAGNARYMLGVTYLQNGASLLVTNPSDPNNLARLNFDNQVAGTTVGIYVTNGALLDVWANGYGFTPQAGVANGIGFVQQDGGTVQVGVNGTGTSKVLTLGNSTTTYKNTYTLNGGNLLVAGAVSAAAGSTNLFNWNGGTLSVATFTAANLRNTPTNTLVNNGGTLAPGGVGTAGKTTITGNYTNTSTSASLNIDIGGTTQATAFQTGSYDFVSVSGTATLKGSLVVNLTNYFTPQASDTFTILTTSANGLNASFTNLDVNNHVAVANVPGASFLLTTNATSVILSGYGALAANFTGTPTAPPINSPVVFTDLSTGSITNRHWDFGDGTVLNTTSTSVSHSYTTAGNKTVSLTVYGTDGSTNMLTQTDYIQVSASASLVWLGDGSANLWNLSAANWTNGFALVPYYDGSDVVFNDTGSIAPAINLTITAQPHSIIFNNTVAKAYTLGGAGKISGTNGLTLQGGGSLTILNTNDYSAETTIVAGTLQLGNGSAMGEVGTNIIVNNAALVLAPPAGSTAFSNSITGSGSVTLNGNATAVLTLLGANTYTSNTVISAGTLKLDPASPLPSGTNNGDLVINGTLDIAAANPVLDAIFGSGVITTTDTGLDGFIVGANGHSGVFNGSIHNGSGTVSLAVTNGATLTLTASSSFSGDVYAANGTVRISANGALGNGPKNIWANGTTAQIALNGTNGNLTLPANYMLLTSHGSPSAALDNLAGNNTVNGPIYLTYGAGGTRIAVDGGTLTLAGAVSVNTNVINDNRVLELSGSGNGTVSGPMTNDPAINGILNVTKTGAGTWTLSNAGNECGYTTVSLGRLLVTGAITNTVAAAVTVTGGALGGTGNLASPVTVTNAGTLEGGDHLNLVYGTLALGSDLNLMRGGACSFRLGATAAGSNDKITVGGNLSVNNTNSVVISAGTLETANDYVLLTVAGTITGSFNTNVTWSGTPPTGSANYSVVTTANQVKLHYTSPVPSPTSITYIASGSSLVLNWPNGQGWRLESQTNSLATGLGTTWVNVTGATSPFTNTVDPANGTVFYRLVYP